MATRNPTPDRVSLTERVPDWPIWVLALASAVAASVLSLSTVLQAFSGEQLRLQPGAELLLAPGAFLIRSLSWAAILVPLHLYAVAYAVGRPADARVPTLHVALPVAVLIIPIAASLTHILTLPLPPPLPAALVAAVGKPASVLLLLMLLVTAAAAGVMLSGAAPKLRVPVALLTPPAASRDPAEEEPPPEREPTPEPADRGDRDDEYDGSTILRNREPFQAILAAEPRSRPPRSRWRRPSLRPPRRPSRPSRPEARRPGGPLRAAPPPATRRDEPAPSGYHVPIDRLLDEHYNHPDADLQAEAEQNAGVLTETLKEFRISAQVTGISRGPAITMYEILPAAGVKLSSIVNLADNIALQLAASRVRIVAPIPGKHAVGIEVPNRTRAIVGFRTLLEHKDFRSKSIRLPIALGQGIAGECQIVDLTQTPHLLIAGATGSGKSVCVNSIICSLICARTPEQLRLLLIDPKIVELKFYNDIPHLLTPVITEPKRAYQALQYCLFEMERRYTLLDEVGVRDVASFNRKAKEKLPYIVIIIDELADLMATTGKELEATLARLAAMSRAVGMHIVLATQRPSIDVITGLIKANIPSRIAFMVAGKFDSRIIIDGVGAEKLLGRGDMLFASAWDPVPVRIQGAFLSDEEVEAVADHVRTLGETDYIDEDVLFEVEEMEGPIAEGSDDPMMEQALDIVLSSGKASASYLQRKLKIGYNRAARLVEEMEARGIVGPAQGSKAREVVHVPSRSD